MKYHRNSRRRRRAFLLRILETGILVFVLFALVEWGLIPAEIQNYNQDNEPYVIGFLVLESQQNLHHELLAQFTYRTADGQWQTIYPTAFANAAIITGASLNLPGFGRPGGVSGSKVVSFSLQQINGSNDPSAVENSVIQLNGGTDLFFNIIHNIPFINELLNAHMYTLAVRPESDYAVHCYNIYALTSPGFTLVPESVTKNCNTPSEFTHPRS